MKEGAASGVAPPAHELFSGKPTDKGTKNAGAQQVPDSTPTKNAGAQEEVEEKKPTTRTNKAPERYANHKPSEKRPRKRQQAFIWVPKRKQAPRSDDVHTAPTAAAVVSFGVVQERRPKDTTADEPPRADEEDRRAPRRNKRGRRQQKESTTPATGTGSTGSVAGVLASEREVVWRPKEKSGLQRKSGENKDHPVVPSRGERVVWRAKDTDEESLGAVKKTPKKVVWRPKTPTTVEEPPRTEGGANTTTTTGPGGAKDVWGAKAKSGEKLGAKDVWGAKAKSGEKLHTEQVKGEKLQIVASRGEPESEPLSAERRAQQNKKQTKQKNVVVGPASKGSSPTGAKKGGRKKGRRRPTP